VRQHDFQMAVSATTGISKPVQIASERSERPDRFGIARRADGRHVNCRMSGFPLLPTFDAGSAILS
jgi:hypothetical protein